MGVHFIMGGRHKNEFDAKKASYKGNKISPRLKFQPFYEFTEKVFVAQHVFAMFSLHMSSQKVTFKKYLLYNIHCSY